MVFFRGNKPFASHAFLGATLLDVSVTPSTITVFDAEVCTIQASWHVHQPFKFPFAHGFRGRETVSPGKEKGEKRSKTHEPLSLLSLLYWNGGFLDFDTVESMLCKSCFDFLDFLVFATFKVVAYESAS
jgi:hypothetical protein